MTATYDPDLIDRLVREVRESIEKYRRDPWRMSDPVVIAESYAGLTLMADQLEAARAEIRRLRDIEVDLAHDNDIREDRIIELTQERDNARWADETRRKAAEVVIAERNLMRPLVEAVERRRTAVESYDSRAERDAEVDVGRALDAYRAAKGKT